MSEIVFHHLCKDQLRVPLFACPNHFCDSLGALVLPFLAILLGIGQVFVTRYSKHSTVLQLLCQRNDVEVKETLFALSHENIREACVRAFFNRRTKAS
jgi:hypothetical protein